MTETAEPSTRDRGPPPKTLATGGDEYVSGLRIAAVLITLFLINAFAQIDRILPFILAEAIKTDLGLSDTQIGLLTGLAFAVCYTLLSLPLARLSDRGSPRFVLITCTLVWSAMTALGGLAASFLFLALTRFGVAIGEAGAIPSAHAVIARKIRPGLRGLAIGIFSMGIPLGTMAGFVVGGAMADTLGWQSALIGAGVLGGVIALLALFILGPTPPLNSPAIHAEPFFQASLKLLASPGFRWLFIGAIFAGFASAPFYAFAAPFLIRTHALTASEAGMAFGLLQGLMGIIGTLVGGRWFDHAVRSGTRRLLGPPAIMFMIASLTTTAALFSPVAWVSVLLLVPAMLSFAFMLPWCFGAAHLVAGRGKEAMASSLAMIGSGLLGPAIGPLLVGMISDTATGVGIPNGLGIGLLLVPFASTLTALAMLVASQRIAATLGKTDGPETNTPATPAPTT